jgi:hypothetical protein
VNGSSGAPAARIHASGHTAAVMPRAAAHACFRPFKRTSPSSGAGRSLWTNLDSDVAAATDVEARCRNEGRSSAA